MDLKIITNLDNPLKKNSAMSVNKNVKTDQSLNEIHTPSYEKHGIDSGTIVGAQRLNSVASRKGAGSRINMNDDDKNRTTTNNLKAIY